MGYESLIVVIILAVLALVAAFEVWMFIHAFKNPAIATNVRLIWLLGMLVLHPFVAIAYYFTDYKKAA